MSKANVKILYYDSSVYSRVNNELHIPLHDSLVFFVAGSVFPARSYILQMKDSVFFSHRASKTLELQVSGWP